MNIADFPLHFLRPWWWLALVPLPLVLWTLARARSGRAALERLADAALLPHLLHDTGSRRRVALGLTAVAWLLAVAALAGPAWQRVEAPLYVNGAARVVALSLSDDMLAADLPPDRMAHARFAVRDLLDTAGDARTALVAYAGAAFTVAPLTDDKRTVLNLLRVLRPDVMPVPGNDAAAGIARSEKLLHDAHVRGGEIVLVTDTADAAAVAAARTAHAHGIRVDVLGVGTTKGAPVPRAGGGFASGPDGILLARRDDEALRAVAQAGGGSYAVLPPDGGRTPAFAAPVATAGHSSHGEQARIWRDGGIWLLPVLVVLAALAFRRGWLLVLAILIMPVAMPSAHAATWPSSWWMNRDQRALHALQRGDTEQARKLAESSGVRGAAEYRAGDFAAAAKAFAKGPGARAHYNLGNALAKAGEYRKAIAAYDKALKLDPGMADARANREAVRKWLAQHAKPSRNGSRNKQGKRQSGSAGHSQSSQQGAQSSPSQQSASPASGGGAKQKPAGTASPQSGGGKPGAQSQHRGAAQNQSPDTPAPSRSAQRAQARQAANALQHELARRVHQPPASSQAFALGQNQVKRDGKLNAEQNALLRSVPDDPGALLRRKFQLEWQQRQTQGQDDKPW